MDEQLEKQFERWFEWEKVSIADCLWGSGRLESPDMPTVSDPEGLCEQFYDWLAKPLDASHGFPVDGINWKKVELDLNAYSSKILKEWCKRKAEQDAEDAYDN